MIAMKVGFKGPSPPRIYEHSSNNIFNLLVTGLFTR